MYGSTRPSTRQRSNVTSLSAPLPTPPSYPPGQSPPLSRRHGVTLLLRGSAVGDHHAPRCAEGRIKERQLKYQ